MGSIPPWTLVLAGGDGLRLRSLTSLVTGDARPKQFCSLIDGESLLTRARRRAALVGGRDRQMVVVTRTHEPFYRDLVADLPPRRIVVQPLNRGTAAGLLYPILALRSLVGDVPLVVLPSDHWVDDDSAFMTYAASAVDVVTQEPGRVVLLGIEPDRPEIEYGWIEPSSIPLPIDGEPAFPIRRFCEKPSLTVAQALFRRGALWNSFVMVGWLTAFIELVRIASPALASAFDTVAPALGSRRETVALETLYATLPSAGFSESVLAATADRLAAVRVKGVMWSDWGHPTRVVASLRRAGREPAWLRRLELASIA